MVRWRRFSCFLVGLLLLTGCVSKARSQAAPTTLTAAAQATELPFGPWGPFSQTHVGPSCLVSRLPQKLFSFPIVVGQERDEVLLRMEQTPEGRTHLRTERVVLERRAIGLAPIQAAGDDRPPAAEAGENRRAQIVEADASGLLWGARLRFAPAAVAQELAPRYDDSGKPVPPQDWGVGEATVEYFPAYADPAADGLLVRITLTNRSESPQNWFVDLLGGIEVTGPDFAVQDLTVSPQEEGTALLQHAANAPVFALAAGTAPVPPRSYRVSDDYFLPADDVTRRDEIGTALPPGLPASAAEPAIPVETKRGRKRKEKTRSEETPPNAGAPQTGGWGLVRLDGIAVAPGQTVTIFLCVGEGKDEAAARDSARILLPLAGDVPAGDTPREGAYSKALAQDRAARFASGSEALDRLAAQSLANAPLFDYRRVGVPTRQDRPGRPGGVFTPAEGGFMALGWAFFRPDFAAAQLNATFLTLGKSDPPIVNPIAVPPTNLFALWELYQRTHDREMLALFYPFARHRYQELLAAGRQKGQDGLYAWPVASDNLHYISAPVSTPAESGKLLFAPDYAAYIIRSARTLERMAEDLHQPPSEIASYTQDRETAIKALNANLWDPARSLYGFQPVSGGTEEASGSLAELLPLIAGADAIPADRRAALLKALADPNTFWSKAGLRSVSKSAAVYHADAAEQGAVHIGPNWLLWKALLDLGETDTARKLAEAVVGAYSAAQAASGACPEWLNGDTGAPGGAPDYSGDACAAIPLYAAYHILGTISTGWDIDLLDSRYDKMADTLHLVFSAQNAQTPGALLCVLGKPDGKYTLSGALQGTVTADPNGVLTLAAPHDTTTQSLDITPVGK
ncbi:MAG TPA: hypothetical protein VFA07_05730 [Chthonomonadaceae bacterium]|nr:hypothetical protein [Chthonomonadaceae bacterium]